MKRTMFGLVLSVAVLTSGAVAGPFVVDDSGIDYTQRFEDTDVEVAYVTLGRVDGRLSLSLDDAASGARALPAIDFVIPDLDREDLFGNEFNADLGDILEFSMLSAGRYAVSLTVSHPDVSVRSVAAAYQEALEQLGYAVQVTRSLNGNSARLVAEHADEIVKIQFAQAGTRVRAHVH